MHRLLNSISEHLDWVTGSLFLGALWAVAIAAAKAIGTARARRQDSADQEALLKHLEQRKRKQGELRKQQQELLAAADDLNSVQSRRNLLQRSRRRPAQ